jgi:hypothetical protein
MEVLGEVKCSVRYRFTDPATFIDLDVLNGMGIVSRMHKEFTFSELKRIDDPRKRLILRNGNIGFESKSCLVDSVEIGAQQVSTSVWAHTKVGTYLLDKVVTMVDEAGFRPSLSQQPKLISYSAQMRVRLNADIKQIFSDKFLTFAAELSPEMAVSEFSNVEVQLPVLAISFLSEPNVSMLIERGRDPDELQKRIRASQGSRVFLFSATNAASYRGREFNVTISAPCDRAMEMLARLERLVPEKVGS